MVKKKKLLTLLSSLAIFAIVGGIVLRLTSSAEAAWFDDTYLYRKPITFTNTGAAVTDMRKVKFDVDTAALITANKMQSDCDDIRFTDSTGTEFPFFFDSGTGACNTNSSDYYVLLPNIPAGTNVVYMYYGNATATAGTVVANFWQTTFSPNSGPTFGTEAQGTSPVSYWAFDEGSGTTVNDFNSSQNNDLTITNAIWKVSDSCNIGNCLYFDGSGDFATKAYSSDTELNAGTGSFTVAGWFKHTSNLSGTDYLISRFSTAAGGNGWKIYTSSSGFCFATDDDNTWSPDDDACTTTTYADSQWHQLVAVKNGTTNIKLYIDGNLQDTQALAGTGSMTATTPPALYVGIDSDGSSNGWDGFIDEVKYYNFAKTDAQVKLEYATKSQAKPASATVGSLSPLQSLNNGLVGYWKLDEGASTVASDVSGNVNTGTLTGSVSWTTGKFGYGTSTAGTDGNYVSVANATNLNPNYVGISLWVNPSATNAVGDSPICKGDGGTEVWCIDFPSANLQPRFYIWKGGVPYTATSTVALATSTWTHLGATFNGNTLFLYINGVLNQTAAVPQTTLDSNSHIVSIGCRQSASSTYDFCFNGKIDDVRVYSRVLSAGEINALYNWAPGPVGHWKLDDVNNGTALDSSGNGNNGTINNDVKLTAGKIGGAAIFDGTNDYINVGDANDELDMGTGSFSYMAWLYVTSNQASFDSPIYKGGAGAAQAGYDMEFGATDWLANIADGTDTVPSSFGNVGIYNQWVHVAEVIDRSTQTMKAYINGVQVDSDDITAIDSVSSATGFQISGTDTAPTDDFKGTIDDVRVYNYARSPKQLFEDMNGGHPTVGTPIGEYVAYWNFDELNSTTANDRSINANSLTLNTASWTTNGRLNAAWNGTGGNVRLSRTTDADLEFNATDNFSLSLWYKSDSATNPAATEYLVADAGPSGAAGYAIYANTSGNICIGIDDDASWGPDVASCSPTDIYDATWHQIVGVRDVAQDKTILFIDGKLVDSDADTTTATLDTSPTFYVGDIDTDDAGSGEEFAGDIDELKVYRSALTISEAQLEYNLGSALSAQTYSNAATPSPGMGSAQSRTYCIPGDTATCTGPVGEWHMDDILGSTTAVDKSGNNTAATLNGQATWAVGKIGGALKLDGTGDFATMATNTFATITSWTLNAWIFPTALADYKTILWKAGNVDLGANYDFQIMANGSILCEFESPGASFRTCQTTTTPITTNKWHFVSCTYNGTITKIYYNGMLQPATDPSDASDCTFSLTPITDATRVLNIGRDPVTGAANDWPGSLDEVQIFGYARTNGQVAWDYNHGTPLAWYKFDECQGTIANDTSGNRLNGTITPGAGNSQTSAGDCTTSSTMWGNGVNGKYNSSINLDGDDYVTVPDNTALDFASGQNFTLSTWINMTSNGGESEIFQKGNADDCENYGLAINGSRKVNLISENACSFSTYQSSEVIPLSTWTHIVATYDGTSVRYYFNGRLTDTIAWGTMGSANSGPLCIGGCDNSQPSTDFITGRMDDARVYNYALTPTQVKTLFNESSSVRFGPTIGTP